MFGAILLFIASVTAFVKTEGGHNGFQWYWNITVSSNEDENMLLKNQSAFCVSNKY